MDQGDIRILELIMDKVKVFELEASWRRYFVDFVVYALSTFWIQDQIHRNMEVCAAYHQVDTP